MLHLINPPLSQWNTPYPATAHLLAAMRAEGWDGVRQTNLNLLFLRQIFSASGIQFVIDAQLKKGQAIPKWIREFSDISDALVPFLERRDSSLVQRILQGSLLPESPRLQDLSNPDSQLAALYQESTGTSSSDDQARYLVTLLMEDYSDYLSREVDPAFCATKYGESLVASVRSFAPLQTWLLQSNRSSLQELFLKQVDELLTRDLGSRVFGITVPFPGNVALSFLLAKRIREQRPDARVIFGGGYINTELRELSDPAVFDYVHAVLYDSGEVPLHRYLQFVDAGERDPEKLIRTKLMLNGSIQEFQMESKERPKFASVPLPSYEGLEVDRGWHTVDQWNPVLRLWTDGHWNKLILAHGCYWAKCTFCDVSLSYIRDYDPGDVSRIVDGMERLIEETGSRGFHFVDEAAPPKLLKALAQEILRRKLVVSWWGNIRFEKMFDLHLCELLARSGCIAVTGGLEVASDRLLSLIQKGVTVEGVARASHAFSQAGVLVHAYLIYGFATQTLQDSVDALELVRQLFAQGCLHSGFWHRFSVTAHSPVGQAPDQFGLQLRSSPHASKGERVFAINDLQFFDPTESRHEQIGEALKKAIYNYQIGRALDWDVRQWFEEVGLTAPKSKEPKNRIAKALET